LSSTICCEFVTPQYNVLLATLPNFNDKKNVLLATLPNFNDKKKNYQNREKNEQYALKFWVCWLR